jgi:phage baseplate assembly protein V
MSDTHERVMNMIARGRLAAADDGEGMQFAQVSLLAGEAKARVERMQQYGFSSVPPVGSEALAVFVGGGRDHGVVVAIDNRASRIRGQATGEVSMYSDEGDYMVLKRGNTIELGTDRLVLLCDVEVVVEAPRVIIRAPEVIIEGNLTVSGEIRASAVYAPAGSVPGPKTE